MQGLSLEKHCPQLVDENKNLTGNEREKLSSTMEYYSSALSEVRWQLYALEIEFRALNSKVFALI